MHPRNRIALKTSIALSHVVVKIKTGSTNHINDKKWIGCGFSRQEGFGAFSVSHSHLSRVANYIRNQELHHHRKSFQEEYVELLERHRVPFDEHYIFKPLDWTRDGNA